MAVVIESLDREGRGIARVEGKAIFIEGGLPGETVSYSSYRRKPSYEQAIATAIHAPSAERELPRCPHFGVCGGCSMQHLEARAQVAVKQRVLEDSLWHIGKLRPETDVARCLRPRLGVPPARAAVGAPGAQERRRPGRFSRAEKQLHRGYAQLRNPAAADFRPAPALRALIAGLSNPARLPQIELAAGEAVTVLVLRILDSLSPADEDMLRAFAAQHGIQFWLQTKGPDTAEPFFPTDAPPLFYSLPEFGVQIHFLPTDFTQVNHAVNRILVRRAVALLDPRPGERIADLFCGLGNFSLPIASRGAYVLGVEGNGELVRRAETNARANGLAARARFQVANLFEVPGSVELGGFDKLLIDPPRDGAVEVVKALGDGGPRRIVYVSCDPATLARDAEVLVQVKGYRLAAAGVINMFPHTSHVESMALFER